LSSEAGHFETLKLFHCFTSLLCSCPCLFARFPSNYSHAQSESPNVRLLNPHPRRFARHPFPMAQLVRPVSRLPPKRLQRLRRPPRHPPARRTRCRYPRLIGLPFRRTPARQRHPRAHDVACSFRCAPKSRRALASAQAPPPFRFHLASAASHSEPKPLRIAAARAFYPDDVFVVDRIRGTLQTLPHSVTLPQNKKGNVIANEARGLFPLGPSAVLPWRPLCGTSRLRRLAPRRLLFRRHDPKMWSANFTRHRDRRHRAGMLSPKQWINRLQQHGRNP
jgi:hypothetical protein